MTDKPSAVGSRPKIRLLASLPVLLFLLPALAPAVLASSPAGSTGTVQVWAYAGSRSFSGSGTTHTGVYAIEARFGFQTVLTERDGTVGTLGLQVNRTMGASINVQYCAPSCAAPVQKAEIGFHGFEQLVGFANLTQNGTVLVNGTPVPAIAIVDSAVRVHAGAYENDSVRLAAPSIRSGALNLSVLVDVQVGVHFTPALGIVPLSPIPGESWSSSSGYTAQGTWQAAYSLIRTLWNGSSITRTGAPAGSASSNGTLDLTGSDLGHLRLADSSVTDQIGISLAGAFHLREGILVVPGPSDLFGGSSARGIPAGNGSVGDSLSAVDLAFGSGARLGLLASSSAYAGTSTQPSPTGIGGGGILPAAVPSEGSGPVEVQAQPESVPSHQQTQCVLAASCATPAPSTAAPLPNGWGLPLALALVVIAIASAAAVARTRPRQPPRPNDVAYPPLGRQPKAAAAVSAPARAPTAPDEAEEPDPLANLW